jgi:membrane protein
VTAHREEVDVRLDPERGRLADRPSAIPVRGWRDVALRVKREIKRDDVPLLAAGVAFFALLALVPALVALVSLYGLVADPADIQRNVDDVLAAAPTEVRDLVQSQLSSVVESSPQGLRLGALAGLVVALWSASSGMKHLIAAVNRAYGEDETRGFIRLRGLSLILTVGAVVALLVALYALIVAPNSLSEEGSSSVLRTTLLVVRWPLLAVAAMCGLAVIYRYAPNRDEPRWNWVSIGAVFATVVWLAASVGFSIYSANFGRYNETYGALGAVVVMMLWLYISAYATVAGAELNAELERQTARDTTTGRPKAMGRREAHAADTLGDSPGSSTRPNREARA